MQLKACLIILIIVTTEFDMASINNLLIKAGARIGHTENRLIHFSDDTTHIKAIQILNYTNFDPEIFAELLEKEIRSALSPQLRDQISRSQAFSLIKEKLK